MEHYPLGCGGNTVMALVEGRQASQNGIIVVSHHCCLFLLPMLLLGARGGQADPNRAIANRVCFAGLVDWC